MFVDKPERTQTQMLIGGLGLHPRDPRWTPLLVGNTAFGGTFTSRLMREVRSKRGWSYGASSRLAYDRQADAFSMWTAPAASDAAACLRLELDLLSAFRREGIDAEELAFVQRYLVRSHAFDVDTAQKRVHQRLEEVLCDLPPGHHDRYLDAVRSCSLAAVNTAVREAVPEEDLVICVVGTHAEIGEAIAASIPGLSTATVAPFDLE